MSLLVPQIGRAQSLAVGSAPSGARVEGPGVKLGDHLVLHLGIGAELRYDSNVYYESDNTTQGLALRLMPTFSLATRNARRDVGPDGVVQPTKVIFRLGAGLDYREWLVANTERPPRQFNVVANFGLTLFPAGPVSFELFDSYVRSAQPAYTATSHNFDRDVNEVGFRLRIKPGGGRLELQIGYVFGIDLWETKSQQPFDNFYHRSHIRLLWKFLPKTSVYIQGENVAYQYIHSDPSVFRPEGYPLRIIAGLNGLLTSKLTFDLFAGYANGFYKAGPSPNTGMAGLTLSWRPYALGVLGFGYRHDILNTLLGVYADLDNVQLSWTQQIWRFGAFLRVAYQNTRYKGITNSTGLVDGNGNPVATGANPDGERTDNGFTANVRFDYFAYKEWVALSLGYDFNLNRSNTSIMGGTPGAVIPVNFNKHEVYLNLSVLF